MDVTGRLRRIGDLKDEVVGHHVDWDTQRRAYRKTLHEVTALGGEDAADELTEWIEERTRSSGRLPKGRRVRQKGADICRERGHPVSTNGWLGAD
jgi:hypothetical protein